MEVNLSNTPLKDVLIKEMALNRNVINDRLLTENVINAVVSHQFSSAIEAMACNNSVEISGFCKFIFNQKRAVKKLGQNEANFEKYTEMLNDETLSQHERRNTQMRLTSTTAAIKALRTKLGNNGSKENI